jgi:hypothetical protein
MDPAAVATAVTLGSLVYAVVHLYRKRRKP